MALAFDSANSGSTVAQATSLTFSHTCSGSSRILIVGVVAEGAHTGITGVTYNGVALTKQTGVNQGSYSASLWYLVAPATGSNNVVVSVGTNKYLRAGSISLTGAAQSSPIDGSNTASGVTSTPSVSVTTSVANSWVIDVVESETQTTAVGGGQTSRFHTASGIVDCSGSTEPTTSAGAVTMSWTMGGADFWASAAMGIKESTSTAYTITAEQVSFALSGVASAFRYARRMVAALGTFALSGQAAILRLGKGIVAATGSFVLTGQSANITSVRTFIAAVGTFTLTGRNSLFSVGRRIVASVGSFGFTWQSFRILINGSSTIWRTVTKPSTTWTQSNKPSTNWTPHDKP